MSHHTIGVVIDKLLEDEDLRLRFANDRVETLGELHAHGLELTSREIDLFIESDVQMWFWMNGGDAYHTH